MKSLKAFSLATILIFCTVTQTACGNAQTLDKVSRAAVALTRGFAAEVESLKNAGLTGKKIDVADAAAKKLTATADSLNAILQKAKTIDESDAAAIAGFVATITSTVGGLLQNPDFLGFTENHILVKITRYSAVALNQLSITLAIYFPPRPAGAIVAASAGGKVVAVSKIKVEIPEAPPEVQALLK
jgi:hypothetical protein